MTGASSGFSRAVAPVCGFSQGTTGRAVSLSCGAREVRPPCAWQGRARHCSRGMEGTRASRRIEEGLSRSFSGCGREPWVPSNCVGDLRQLLRVLTLWDPKDCSPPGSSVHGILQARILEWVAISSSRVSSQFSNLTHVSYVSWIGRQVLYQ